MESFSLDIMDIPLFMDTMPLSLNSDLLGLAAIIDEEFAETRHRTRLQARRAQKASLTNGKPCPTCGRHRSQQQQHSTRQSRKHMPYSRPSTLISTLRRSSICPAGKTGKVANEEACCHCARRRSIRSAEELKQQQSQQEGEMKQEKEAEGVDVTMAGDVEQAEAEKQRAEKIAEEEEKGQQGDDEEESESEPACGVSMGEAQLYMHMFKL